MKSYTLLFFAVLLLFFACRKDENFTTDSGAKLIFSVDTLRFDTVFTQLGSATRILKLYNNNTRAIRIEKIMVVQGDNSHFRINVDGLPGNTAEGIKIPAEDSLYIFAEVTVDPDAPLSVSPFVIHDEIQFLTNDNAQTVVLEAWGQNANYVPNQFGNGGIAGIQCNGGEVVWDDEKPYVIFGIFVVDDCTLTVREGTKIYVHGGLERFIDEDSLTQFYNDGRIIVTETGRINIEGTVNRPVIIQGDRLEPVFAEESGQWFGIILSAGSKGNIINHATVKNSIVGVAVDSSAQLTTNFSQFLNTTSNALLGIHSSITANSCLIANSASTGLRLTYGGTYDFTHCTVASYGVDASALSLSNILCADPPLCATVFGNDLQATFRNCIIAGSRSDEIILTESFDFLFDYSFDHCIVRVEDILMEDQYPRFLEDCNNCYNMTNTDTLFVSTDELDYHLDSLSIAEERGVFIPGFDFDIDGKMRDMTTPDLGCYEYVDE